MELVSSSYVSYKGNIMSSSRYKRFKTVMFEKRKVFDIDFSDEIDFEIRIRIRGNRNFKGLPNDADDFIRIDCYDRSWKRYRNNQYK